ncbi:GNAT family N-acetyltransferase [Neorhizobium sp. JUb45]|uniref:GNAT family N-acetyltransferase n=1 Tax=unclassified Neorhizobium TaxID=2629175 RepID=UPI00104D1455|nr:GNAT family N-acetyltransferase [Neorhizobium sp. JUb45]TCR02670.1 acetyltransferase (GNAT) family protein [Neorhizobium sp. JUb45]
MTTPMIRPLDAQEVGKLLEWAADEGWNPGLADAPAFLAADPEGFLGCFIADEMVAGVSAVRYDSDFGFIGLYITHPDFRGKGFGRRVWDAGMAHLAGRTIGLDGVPQQQSNYRTMGFLPAYETFRWSGRVQGAHSEDVVRVGEDLLPPIVAYDRRFFPAGRQTFLAEWLKPPRITFAILRNGAINGFAVLRRCQEGFKIGPLFAENSADAESLLVVCSAQAGDEMLHIDVPGAQQTFAGFLKNHAFTRGFVTSRMYRGAPPVLDDRGVFGITTLELG